MHSPSELRAAVVATALSHEGQNASAVAWADTIGPHRHDWPRHWCGGFALYCLHAAGLALEWRWKIGLGFLYRLPRTTTPQVGDVAYFARNQHHAIVMAVDGSALTTVDGNSTGNAVRVKEGRKLSDVSAFYSIAPLLKDAGEPPTVPAAALALAVLRLRDPMMTGEDVEHCRDLAIELLRTEGGYGPLLEALIRAIQKSKGITQDGVVGNRETWPALTQP